MGHTLGLNHDGRTNPSEGYYSGHGSGETGWAPIMGVGYYQNLAQWSKGEYLAANNTQDDLAIITGQNGFGYRADDMGSTLGTARALTVSGTAVSASGIIERNTDVDFFSFTTGAGAISLAVTPSGRSPNLDILAELYDATGTLVATANPADLLAASLNATLSAGTYYLKVDGTGKGDPQGTGYSDYGSLGQYGITGTIMSSNAPPSLAIAPTNASQTEGNNGSKAFTFTVTRSGDTSGANAANWAVTDSGSNPADATDFANNTLPSGTLSFAAGETSQVITVDVQGDTTVEFDETFTVTLSNPTNGATLTTATALGTILNDDLPPVITLAVSPASVTEDGSTNLVYTFSRSGITTDALTVNYTVGGTATLGTDYTGIAITGTAKTVTFAANSPTATVIVAPTADTTIEGDETVALTLATGTGYYTVGTTTAVTGTITNDDVPPPASLAIAPTNASQTEGNSGSKAFTFTVSRSNNTSGANAVNWAVTGSGSNPADATDFANNTLPSGKVSFAAGETSKVITVNVKGDSIVEFDESFTVTLSNPTNGATVTTATALGTILNDDLPVITISANDPNAGETANPGVFTLTRTGPTTSPLTVNLGIGGSATNGTDYVTLATTAVFAIGATTAVVPLTPVDDLVVEGNETAILTLLSGSSYTLGSATSATVTIADNDRNGTVNGETLTGDGGNNALNGLGGNDVLNGGAGSDRLNGGVGKDTLTGGTGIDQFVLGALGDSLLGGFDVITDYALGEQIDVPVTIAPITLNTSSGNATGLTATAIQAVLTGGVFTANSARAFTVTGQTGTFLALNDGTAGFSASTDSIIHLSNYIIGAINTVAIV